MTGAFPDDTSEKIRARRYECFYEDIEPKLWTPGQCAGYVGRNLHLERCKRRDGWGLSGLFCKQHSRAPK